MSEVSALTDATNPNLAPFFARGGRVIMLHGLADEVISPNSTIDYYKQLIATVGQAAVDEHVRFYTVPGMGHGTGSFIPNWDSLAALEGWVEAGLAPATGVAVDAVAGTYGRTRPLCQFPAWPKYRGSGSLDAAVNYSCVTEVGDPLACPNLPAAPASYKGGNSFGEELRVDIDPATMAYTVTIDASLQRAAGTQRSGSLVAQGSCSYASGESAAVFSFAPGGVLLGGVNAPSGGGFAPLDRVPEHLREHGRTGGVQPGGQHLQRGRRATGHRRRGGACVIGAAAQCGHLPVLPRCGDRRVHDLRRHMHADGEGLHHLQHRARCLRPAHHLAHRRRRDHRRHAHRVDGDRARERRRGAAAPGARVERPMPACGCSACSRR